MDMAENTETRSNRDRYMERLKAKYPDRDFTDDETLFGQINDDYDESDRRLSEYDKERQDLSEFLSDNPRAAAFLSLWKKGEDPLSALISTFGDDFKAALEDPDKVEELAAANKEYVDRLAQAEDYETQYQNNIAQTLSTIDKIQSEQGLSDEDVDAAMDFLVGIVRDGLLGKFSEESIAMARKALGYEEDVALANREGEVRGRNAKIEEKLRRSSGDNLPALSGKNAKGEAQKVDSIFSLAKQAQ